MIKDLGGRTFSLVNKKDWDRLCYFGRPEDPDPRNSGGKRSTKN